MTREEAIKNVKTFFEGIGISLCNLTKESFNTLIPELAESENERIRKEMIEAISEIEPGKTYIRLSQEEKEAWIAYLEKQKEQKPVESNDCPELVGQYDNEYMLNTILSNYHLHAEVLKKQGDTEGYKLEKSKENWLRNVVEPLILKEQKSILKFKVGDKIHLIDGTSPNYEDDCITIREIDTINYIGEFKEGYVPIKEQDKWELVKEQRLAGWSEEDEIYLQDALWCVKQACKVARGENDMGACWSAERWLNSLRPQPKEGCNYITPSKEFFQWIYDRLIHVHKENPDVDYMRSFKERINNLSFEDKHYWKPSKEQIEALKVAMDRNDSIGYNLGQLYEQLKKLM